MQSEQQKSKRKGRVEDELKSKNESVKVKS